MFQPLASQIAKGEITVKNLTAQIKELKELRLMAEELAAEITTIEDGIKAEMTAQGVNEMLVDIFKVRWTPVTSSRVDTAALKKELPDIAARFTKTTESRRFSIA